MSKCLEKCNEHIQDKRWRTIVEGQIHFIRISQFWRNKSPLGMDQFLVISPFGPGISKTWNCNSILWLFLNTLTIFSIPNKSLLLRKSNQTIVYNMSDILIYFQSNGTWASHCDAFTFFNSQSQIKNLGILWRIVFENRFRIIDSNYYYYYSTSEGEMKHTISWVISHYLIPSSSLESRDLFWLFLRKNYRHCK